MARRLHAVLFDLDGTLVDSAPDLVDTVVWLRAQHGLDPIETSGLGMLASRGALGLIEAGFSDRADLDRAALREQFLAHYTRHLWVRSRPYEGVEPLLDALRERQIALAVVTNKPTALARAVIEAAGWQKRFDCLVGGGCTALPKPHPAPVLEACRRLAIAPGDTWMIGDDRRDIEAGRRAGSLTIAAAWGYLAGDDPAGWNAHQIVSAPDELHSLLIENNGL